MNLSSPRRCSLHSYELCRRTLQTRANPSTWSFRSRNCCAAHVHCLTTMRWRSRISAKWKARPSSLPFSRDRIGIAQRDRNRHRCLQRRFGPGVTLGGTLRTDHHRPAGVHLLPDGRRAALRGDPPRLGRGTNAQAQQQDPARRGHPHRPRARDDMRPAAPTAPRSATLSHSASTTRTAGSPRPRSDSGSHSSPTTPSSRPYPASRSNRWRETGRRRAGERSECPHASCPWTAPLSRRVGLTWMRRPRAQIDETQLRYPSHAARR
jgi:hypothetical protein